MLKKKYLIIILSMILFIFVPANEENQSTENHIEIELFFENIKIDQINFTDVTRINIHHDDNNDITISYQSNRVYIKSPDQETKITLILPIQNRYIYTFQSSDEYSYCQFSFDQFFLFQNGKLVVHFKDNVLSIEDEKNESGIRIDQEMIRIKHEDGTTTDISSKGIINSNKEKDNQFNGFWGKIIGNAIQFGIKFALNNIAGSPGDLAKVFINSDLNENTTE
jgi:hypothetical protein